MTEEKVWSVSTDYVVQKEHTGTDRKKNQLQNSWKSFLEDPEKEAILMSGLFETKSGGDMGKFEQRKLFLTNKPCLF
jgi:hypothetical protein